MEGHLKSLVKKGKNLIICGDFNIAHKEIDLKNPKQNMKNAGFLPEERAWMDRLLSQGFTDLFRKFNQEPDQYTWWSYRPTIRERNIGWRIDYFVSNQAFDQKIQSIEHQTKITGSDHCPILLHLK
jgi:exodeoxyribonuclease-3